MDCSVAQILQNRQFSSFVSSLLPSFHLQSFFSSPTFSYTFALLLLFLLCPPLHSLSASFFTHVFLPHSPFSYGFLRKRWRTLPHLSFKCHTECPSRRQMSTKDRVKKAFTCNRTRYCVIGKNKWWCKCIQFASRCSRHTFTCPHTCWRMLKSRNPPPSGMIWRRCWRPCLQRRILLERSISMSFTFLSCPSFMGCRLWRSSCVNLYVGK